MGHWIPSFYCKWEMEKKTYLPTEKLRNVSELIDGPDDLRIAAANGQDMPYIGWIETTFKLAAGGAVAEEVVVPMLVIKGQHLSQPIVGYNVIERIVTTAINHPDETSNSYMRFLKLHSLA